MSTLFNKPRLFLLSVASCLLSCQEKPPAEAEVSPDADHVENGEEMLVDYNFHIRPILSDKCFFCHGPDEKNNKGKLRLDNSKDAYAALKESDGYAIVPSDPHNSAVWQRIITEDSEERMPPLKSKLVLTEKEKELIKLWIKQGAEYKPHWAFTNLRKSIPVPDSAKNWAKNPIDEFVHARLSKENLKPSPAASPERWLRRATLDLTGFTPKPEEITAFLTDVEKRGDAAYAAAADRLLASPSYGEHQAVAWLDAVRYADSYGFQSDQLNTQWPYRDWVVRAFNDNLPYDTFLTWNVAGDLVENPTTDTLLATAYNRLHRLTNEGGSIREEFIAENAADRLHTFGTSVLGLTMECSRCHDHKFDPISARDYYSLSAFFNSIPEHGLYDHAAKVPSPSLLLPNPAQKKALANAKANTSQKQSAHEALIKSRTSAFQQWLDTAPPTPVIPDLASHYNFDLTIRNIPNVAHGAKPTDKGSAGGLKLGEGVKGKALICSGDNGASFPQFPFLERYTPFTFSFWIKDTLRQKNRSVVMQNTFGTDVGYNGMDIMIEDGFIEARIFRVWPGNGIGIRSKERLTQNQWQQLTWSYDGSSLHTGLKLYLNGKPLATGPIGTSLTKSARIRTYGAGRFTIGQRFRDKGFKGGMIDELQLYTRALTPVEAAHLHDKTSLTTALTQKQASLTEYYFSAIDAPARASMQQLTTARKSIMDNENAIFEIPIMRELATPRVTHILERGAYDAEKTDENIVTRDTFETFLPPFPKDAPRNRLGLAQWTTQPDHPLTSRVFVNRMWQNFFGIGLVNTPENFGLQGAIPTHPDLLDWLARDFVNQKWDIKKLCKKIVLSSTYRQDSALTKELLEKDPENMLLARGPAHRLSAEQIRDLALSTSGLLKTHLGGAPASPYQPGRDLWRESNGMSPAYRQGEVHRRSLYSVWKRTAPLPNMMAFDATSREVCAVARERTNTPIQALVLLNDVQFVEAARTIASNTLSNTKLKTNQEKIQHVYLTLTGKSPSPRELEILTETWDIQLAHYKTRAEDAKKLIALGNSKAPAGIDAIQLAAFTTVCQTILNLDATIWKR